MAKRVYTKPDWLENDSVRDIYSLSGCISKDFCDYIRYWKHNGFWLFNTPAVMAEVATAASVDLSTHALFYYELHEEQFDEQSKTWAAVEPISEFDTRVAPPTRCTLEGFDVVSFSAGSGPECSPLSCNYLAKSIPVNPHCLLASLDEAKNLLERGAFDAAEPGPFRIVAVYSCPAE